MSILIFLAVLFVLVLVHELGHFVVAKWMGMRVDEFGIGFPPKVFSIKKGETEYSLNVFPIGGFVRIYGEDPTAVIQHDNARAFGSKSRWAQAAVLVAGVFMNVLFAWVLFTAVLSYGIPTVVEEADAGADTDLIVTAVLPESPAAQAGIPNGAEILGLETSDEKLTPVTASTFSAFVHEHADEDLTLTYRSRGDESTVTLRAEEGIVETDNRPAIGVALAHVEYVSYPILGAMREAFSMTVTTFVAVATGLGNLLKDTLSFSADFSDVAGPVGIVGLVGDAAEFGIVSVLIFTAVISLNLAVINLLPFPALDGGRLAFVAIEGITGKAINPVWAARVNYVGFVILIGLMVAVTYNDIMRVL